MNTKIQLSLSIIQKKGFTLVEIMIVILLMGVFFYSTTLFNDNRQTERQKAERIINLIADTIQTENANMFLGKMPIRNGQTADTIEIFIDKNTEIRKVYYNSGIVLYSGSVTYPFFDNDPGYKIHDLRWESGTGNTVTISITSDKMTFNTGAITSPWVEIETGYGVYKSIITIDRRVGKVEITR